MQIFAIDYKEINKLLFVPTTRRNPVRSGCKYGSYYTLTQGLYWRVILHWLTSIRLDQSPAAGSSNLNTHCNCRNN